MELTHVFVLILILNGSTISQDMYFWDVTRCNYFASQLVKRYGNYKYYKDVPEEHKATGYCKPVLIDPSKVKVYK